MGRSGHHLPVFQKSGTNTVTALHTNYRYKDMCLYKRFSPLNSMPNTAALCLPLDSLHPILLLGAGVQDQWYDKLLDASSHNLQTPSCRSVIHKYTSNHLRNSKESMAIYLVYILFSLHLYISDLKSHILTHIHARTCRF